MKKMKKLLSLVMSIALVFGSLLFVNAAEQPSWEFGGAALEGQDGSAQGQNGWYFMWSPETDKAGDLDISQIKESVASETGSSFFAYGTGKLVEGGTKGWVPDIYAAEEYDPWSSNNWWLQNIDGTMSPAVVTGVKATAVLGFKAPEAGEYRLDFTYEAGAANVGETNDGLVISVNSKAGKLYSKATSTDKKDNETTTVNASLNQGDMVYFAADPNKTGDNDTAKFNVKVAKTSALVDNQKVFAFGYKHQDGSAQGQNGWYFMWSPETDKAGNLDAAQIKECVASDVGSAWFAYGSGFLVGGTKGWLPDIYAADGYDPWASNNWWLQNTDGTMNPAVVTGDKATSIVGFKAPKAGEYKFTLAYEAGAAAEGAGNDGVTVSINTSAGKLFAKAASASAKDTGTESATVTLKAGDMVYFAADPNKTGDNDVANLKVVAEVLSFATEEVKPAETNPETGDAGIWGLGVLVLVSAGALIFISKKKAHKG